MRLRVKPAELLAFVCLLIVAALGRNRSAHAADESESVPELRWAPAPEFWDQVEKVLNDKPVFDYNGRYQSLPTPEQRLQQYREGIQSMRTVPFPQLKGLQRVRVYGDPHFPKEFTQGFLIGETPNNWYVFTSQWRLKRIEKQKHTRIEDVDLNRDQEEVRKFGESLLALNRSDPVPNLERSFRQARMADDLSVAFLLNAYVAYEHDRPKEVEPLIRAAFYAGHDKGLFECARNLLAWQLFEPAVIDLNEGAPRAEIAKRFRRIEKEFPGGRYEAQAKEYAGTLEKMAVEEARYTPRANSEKLPPAEQVKIEIFRLRDCHNVQWMQPGSCSVLSGDFPYEDTMNPADQLALMGFEAVPALLDLLDDTRLTRCYGFYRNFTPWRDVLQYRDGAIQILSEIAGGPLYDSSQKPYLSTEPDERRIASIRRANDWWKTAQIKGEAACLRDRMKSIPIEKNVWYPQAAFVARRLLRLEGPKAIPDLRAWSKENRYSSELSYTLLLEAKDPDIEAELRAKVLPNADAFELAALNALRQSKRISQTEYQALLYEAAAACLKIKPERLQEFARPLLESAEERSVVLVGETLRHGWSKYLGVLPLRENPELGLKLAPYLLPYLDDKTFSIRHDAASCLNIVLGEPLQGLHDLSEHEPDEFIVELKKLCSEKGIKPAF